MKKPVPGSLGFILLTILSGSALAADLSRREPVHTKAPMMAPGYDWTGIYIGINGGGGWGTSRFDFPAFGTTTGDFSTSGALVGALSEPTGRPRTWFSAWRAMATGPT